MNSAVTLTQLRYFVEVARQGSFGKAAQKCFVTQPTLSMQLQKLEETLGVTLLDRSRKPVRPTRVGEQLLHRSAEIVRLADSLVDLVREEKGDLGGEFRLGVIPTLAPYLLPRFLPSFLKRYPKVKLVVEETETQVLIDRLRADTLDAGIAATPLESRGIKELPLFVEPFAAYLSKAHPLLKKRELADRDLDPEELWLLNEGHCFRTQVLNLCRSRPPQADAPLSFESGNLEMLRRLVDSQHGATLLPELAVLELTKSRRSQVRNFRSPQPAREVSLVHSRAFLRIGLIESLAEVIRESLPPELTNKQKKRVIPVGSFK